MGVGPATASEKEEKNNKDITEDNMETMETRKAAKRLLFGADGLKFKPKAENRKIETINQSPSLHPYPPPAKDPKDDTL